MEVGLRNPLVVLEQSCGVLRNSAHGESLVIECLDAFALVHVLYLSFRNEVWLPAAEINVWVGVSPEEFSCETLEEVFVCLFLGDWSFGENLNQKNITHWP